MKKHRIKMLAIVGMMVFSSLTQASLNDGLIAYYPFNGNANDESGNGNNGVVTGSQITSDRNGNLNTAYLFNSSGNKITVQDNPQLSFGNSMFSMVVWIKSTQQGIWKRIVTKRAPTNSGNWYSLAINNNKAWFEIYAQGDLYSTKPINDGNWHFIAVTRDVSTNKYSMYIDGVLDATIPDTGLDLNTTANTPLEIGVWSNESYDSGTFNGTIDDIRIYNRALPESEIQELYNEGSAPNEEEPVAVATPEVYVNTHSQNIFKDETLQVFFNTSVLASMSQQYDVYFSINWDDVTLYDNGVDLVTDKQPLFNNIVVPELSNWFEYERLRYTFPEGVPQTDYVLGLHLVDNEDNVVFENFSSVSYFPEEPPFSSTGKSRKQPKTVSSFNRQSKSSSKKCHLGGIRTDLENATAKELDKATRRSMLALQMGSSFMLEGQLKTLYQRRYHGVKSAYNLLKKGKKVCDYVNHFETELDAYDENMKDDRLTDEQASNLFAIELLTSALSLTQGGGFLYSGFDSNDLVNGIKDYYNYRNKQFSAISSLNNSATIKIKFEQPFHWFQFASGAVKLKVTATPVFTYAVGYEFTDLNDVPKHFTDSDNIEEKSIDLGEADSDRTSFGNIDYILKTTLTRGLYLIKASTASGDEVFRDTIHVTREGQEHTMVVDR